MLVDLELAQACQLLPELIIPLRLGLVARQILPAIIQYLALLPQPLVDAEGLVAPLLTALLAVVVAAAQAVMPG